MLSVIIPTLNEENYLKGLIENILPQLPNDSEIIVSDGASDDSTITVAKKLGCIVVSSEKRSPAIQRNTGALRARGDILLFVDADTRVPDNFINQTLSEFTRRQLDAGAFFFEFRSKKMLYKLATVNAYLHMYLFNLYQPLGIGAAIIVKHSTHVRVGGFDERIMIGEDHEYCRNISRLGFRYGLLRSTKIFYGTRRLEKEGPWTVLFKWYRIMVYYFLHGPIVSKVVPYEFGKYNE